MPLEFALRSRIDLDRPARRRRRWRVRVPPLALPIAAYWLAIAGVTHALIKSATADAPGNTERAAVNGLGVDDGAASELPTSAFGATNEPTGAGSEPIAARALEPTPPPSSPLEINPPPALPPEPPLPADDATDAAPSNRALGPTREPISRAAPPRVAVREPREPEPAPLPPPVRRPTTMSDEGSLRREPSEPRDEAPAEIVRAPSPKSDTRTSGLPSCEAAAASANQSIDLRSKPGAPDLPRESFAAVLENGAYLNQCPLGERTRVEICAAVQDGRVVGVSVTTEPRDAALSACIRRAVAGLRFPRSAQLDVTRTRFEPAR